MKPLLDTAMQIVEPFTAMTSRLHPLWHATGLGLVAFLFVVRRARRRERVSLRALFDFLFPASVYRHWSSWLDVKFFVVNRLAWSTSVGWLAVSTTFLTSFFLGAIRATLGEPIAQPSPSAAVNVTYSVMVVLFALDLAAFFSHYLMHKVPTLWEFHKVHHAAVVLNPLTNLREHPVDDLVRRLFEGPLIAAINAGFMYRFPNVELFALWGVPLVWIPFNLTNNLRHTHLWLAYPRWLSPWFISPAMHQAHHGSDPHHVDVNFGRVLAVWDRLARSLYVPVRQEPIHFGLGGEEQEYRTLWSLYARPFRNAWQKIWRPRLVSWRSISRPMP